jgi:hypothetical protein
MRISFTTLFTLLAIAGSFVAATPSPNDAMSLPLSARGLKAYPDCVCGKDKAGNKVRILTFFGPTILTLAYSTTIGLRRMPHLCRRDRTR